eukprot:PhF_6_TR16922/c0_g1_i1/m.25423
MRRSFTRLHKAPVHNPLFVPSAAAANPIPPSSVRTYSAIIQREGAKATTTATIRNVVVSPLMQATYCPHPTRVGTDLMSLSSVSLSDAQLALLFDACCERIRSLINQKVSRRILRTEKRKAKELWFNVIETSSSVQIGVLTCSAALRLCSVIGAGDLCENITAWMTQKLQLPLTIENILHCLRSCSLEVNHEALAMSYYDQAQKFTLTSPKGWEIVAAYLDCIRSVGETHRMYNVLSSSDPTSLTMKATQAFLNACSRIVEPGGLGCTMAFTVYKTYVDSRRALPPIELVSALTAVVAAHGRSLECKITMPYVRKNFDLKDKPLFRSYYVWSLVAAGEIANAVKAIRLSYMNGHGIDHDVVRIVLSECSWELTLVLVNAHWKFRKRIPSRTVAMCLDRCRSNTEVVWRLLIKLVEEKGMEPSRYVLGVLYDIIETTPSELLRLEIIDYLSFSIFRHFQVSSCNAENLGVNNDSIPVLYPPTKLSKDEITNWTQEWTSQIEGGSVPVIVPFKTLFTLFVLEDLQLPDDSTVLDWKECFLKHASKFKFLTIEAEHRYLHENQKKYSESVESFLALNSKRPFHVGLNPDMQSLYVRYALSREHYNEQQLGKNGEKSVPVIVNTQKETDDVLKEIRY